MEKTEEEIKELKDYRKSILEQKSKSDDDFEKYITLIASGGLALTITFIDKISPFETSVVIWLMILGWVFLSITLFLNLLSHYLSSRYNEKTIDDLDKDISYENLTCRIDKRNSIISTLNLISIISLGIGILSIIIFTSINAYNHG